MTGRTVYLLEWRAVDKAFWSALAALVAGLAATIGWLWLLIALSARFAPLPAYALSVVPLLAFLGAALAYQERDRRRLRKRLRDQEMREN
jgi:hypothetical protein